MDLPTLRIHFELGKTVKVGYLQRFLPALIAVGFGAVLVGSAHAQRATPTGGAQQLDQLHTKAGVECADCHGAGKRTGAVAQETCLGCHGDSKQLAAKTAKVLPTNPHATRHYGTEADCGLCHRQHEPSVNFCLDCHPRFDFKVK